MEQILIKLPNSNDWNEITNGDDIVFVARLFGGAYGYNLEDTEIDCENNDIREIIRGRLCEENPTYSDFYSDFEIEILLPGADKWFSANDVDITKIGQFAFSEKLTPENTQIRIKDDNVALQNFIDKHLARINPNHYTKFLHAIWRAGFKNSVFDEPLSSFDSTVSCYYL